MDWPWGGECFGYREGNSLFTYFGKEIGRFDGEEIHTERSDPTTRSSSIRKIGARGGSRTHMRKNPRRILSSFLMFVSDCIYYHYFM